MRQFNGGSEIRLTREDLMAALEYVINERILGSLMKSHTVDTLTLHPDAKYVVRVTIVPQTGS